MRIAIPVWSDRISPVFDVAGHLLLVDLEAGGQLLRDQASLDQADLGLRARQLAGLGVNVLICGAISRPLEAMIAAQGVRVISQVCGPVNEIIQAFLAGQLDRQEFQMPGCCRRRRRGFGGGAGRGWGRRGRKGDFQ